MAVRYPMLVAALMASTAVVAQPTCPLTVEVRVEASLLPDGQAVTVGARWITDWSGAILSVRVDTVAAGADRPRGELHPRLQRAIQHAIKEQVRCTPHADGTNPSQYPFIGQVTVRSA